jgi:hypothetical protein
VVVVALAAAVVVTSVGRVADAIAGSDCSAEATRAIGLLRVRFFCADVVGRDRALIFVFVVVVDVVADKV